MLEIRIPDWLEFPSKEQALKYGEQAEVSVFLKAEAIFLLFDGSKEKILPQQTELYQFSYLKGFHKVSGKGVRTTTQRKGTGVSVSGALVSGRRIKPRRGGLLWRLR